MLWKIRLALPFLKEFNYSCKSKTTENGYKALLTYQWKVQVNFPARTSQLTHVATVQLSTTG